MTTSTRPKADEEVRDMRETEEERPEGEQRQIELDEELEHLEEDVQRRGLLSKLGEIFKTLFGPREPEQRKEG